MINIVGPSSCGKTTALRVAKSLSSVGQPGSWFATINAMEDLGQASNDGALFLDEGFHAGADHRTRALTQSAVVMALSSGMVKARKGQVSPPAAKFSAISTSNGYVTSYGGNTAAVDPALMVRMPVIDLVGRRYGILDCPGPDGAARIIDRLNAATSMYGGAPVEAFLVGLTGALAADRAKLNREVAGAIAVFRQKAVGHGKLTPMEERIIGRFALAYSAGFLAKRWGVFPASWNEFGSGMLTLFNMAREVLEVGANTDPIVRLELGLRRIRARLFEENNSSPADAAPGIQQHHIGAIRHSALKGIELLMRKSDFERTFNHLGHDLIATLRTAGALADPETQANGQLRPTVKRTLYPGQPPERVIAVRLERSAYPNELKVHRAE